MAEAAPAIAYVISNEKGYNPNDNGVPSNFGIRQAGAYAHIDVKSLTVEEASAIYLRDFWIFGGFTSQRLANKILDFYVNLPPAVAIRLLQSAIAFVNATPSVVCDGVLGPITIAAVNNICLRLGDPSSPSGEDRLIDELKFRLVAHYDQFADPSEKDGLWRRAVKG
jgi:lysozyme family protein